MPISSFLLAIVHGARDRERAGRRLLGCHTRVVSHVCLGAQIQLPCNFAGKFDA